MKVTTVLGDVCASELGVTLPHELSTFRIFHTNRDMLLRARLAATDNGTVHGVW